MIVTEIEDCGSGNERSIWTDSPPLCFTEVAAVRHHIEKDQELPEAVYREIIDEILWKRIRMRCLYLLKSMDRTEYQLPDEAEVEFLSRTHRSGHSLAENLTISTMSAMRRAISRTHGESEHAAVKAEADPARVPDVIQEALENQEDRTREELIPQVGEEEKQTPQIALR